MTPKATFTRYWLPLSALAFSIFTAIGMYSASAITMSQEDAGELDFTGGYQWMTLVTIGALWVFHQRSPVRLKRILSTRFIFWVVGFSVVLVFLNFLLTEAWTVKFSPQQEFRIVIGDRLSAEAMVHRATKPCSNDDPKCLLKGFQGNALLVWDPPAVRGRYFTLVAIRLIAYLACLTATLSLIYGLALSSRSRNVAAKAK